MLRDRIQAGQVLAAKLLSFREEKDLLVVGLPRGGVPIARIVADVLHAELDVCLVRKLGVPWQPELALGALAEGGVRVVDSAIVAECGLRSDEVEQLAKTAASEIERRSDLYRGARPAVDVKGRFVIVVDDGLATGSTMLAAVRALRARGARRIVVAVPVAPPSACEALRREADHVVCLETHEPFDSVGSWYENFNQVDDLEVQQTLASGPSR